MKYCSFGLFAIFILVVNVVFAAGATGSDSFSQQNVFYQTAFEFISVWGLFMLTVITPGPDFLIVTQTSLKKGFKTGVATALGIGCGLLFHCSYCILGIAALIKQAPWLFSVLRIIGGLYIGYLGLQSLRSASVAEMSGEEGNQESVFVRGGWLTGLLVNVLNVKAMIWFLVFFTSIIPESFSIGLRTLFAGCALLGATAFFCFLALIISRPKIVQILKKSGRAINIIIGLAFLFIAGEIIWGLFQ